MTLVLVGLTIRSDLAGVTSLVRASWLVERTYDSLLHFFHSPALNLDKLREIWVGMVFKLFQPVEVAGRPVFVAV